MVFNNQSKSFIDDIKKKKNGISSSYDHYKDIKIIEQIWKMAKKIDFEYLKKV